MVQCEDCGQEFDEEEQDMVHVCRECGKGFCDNCINEHFVEHFNFEDNRDGCWECGEPTNHECPYCNERVCESCQSNHAAECGEDNIGWDELEIEEFEKKEVVRTLKKANGK